MLQNRSLRMGSPLTPALATDWVGSQARTLAREYSLQGMQCNTVQELSQTTTDWVKGQALQGWGFGALGL